MHVALVHDHFAQDGGAEKVVRALSDLYPDAPIYTLVHNPAYTRSVYPDRAIHASFLQQLPGGVRRYQWYLPLMPMAIESHNLENYNVVISSASSFAKGVLTRPDAVHICYCHTPTRYLWHYSHHYLDELRLAWPLRQAVGGVLNRVRLWDMLAAQRVDHFIANSSITAQRIKKYYGRESVVIHPPVPVEQFTPNAVPQDYFLAGGRLTPYKRFDIAIRACTKLDLPLKIFGEGPDFQRLKRLAGPRVTFLGKVSEEEKRSYLSRCRAFLYPQEEDFGITAVEALASGRPVIAYGAGGATETVQDGVTGIFFYEQTWEELAHAILRLQRQRFDPQRIAASVQRFGTERFHREISGFVQGTLKKQTTLSFQPTYDYRH